MIVAPPSILLENAPAVKVKALPAVCLEYAAILWDIAGQDEWYREWRLAELRHHVSMCLHCLRRLRAEHDLDKAGPEDPEMETA